MQPTASKSIVWLASYPKSGNTWLRIFLANYLLDAAEPVPLAELHRVALGDAQLGLYRKLAGPAFLPADEMRTLDVRARVLTALAGRDGGVRLLKTHNANMTVAGRRLVPPPLTRRAVYVVRDPRDLVLSYADHYGMDLETTVTAIASPHNRITPDKGNVTQYLGTWSDHVKGWARCRDFPVHVLRYEDLIADPARAFAGALRALDIAVEEDRLARAVRFASFDTVRAQESETGFVEKSPHSQRFFRAGRSGQWRDALDPALAERIVADHRAVMRAHRYLP